MMNSYYQRCFSCVARRMKPHIYSISIEHEPLERFFKHTYRENRERHYTN